MRPMQGFRSILVDVDATATAQPALERAARIARTCGARLRVVDVISAPAEARRNLREDLEDELMTRRRERLVRIAYGVRDVPVDTDVLAGVPADALIQDVLRFGHDLLVRSHARDVVARGPTPFRAVDVQLIQQCPCPVWAVGPGAVPEHPKILGAVDAAAEDPIKQELNAKVIELALLLAHFQEGSLVLLQAWRPFAETRVLSHTTDEDFSAYLDSTRRRIKEDFARVVESFGHDLAGVQLELRRGDIEEVIPAFAVAEGVDLVVMGTRGRTGISRRLVGNTAERVLQRLLCSIVAVKPDGFVSPVRVNESEL
jgi:universal stress protein E